MTSLAALTATTPNLPCRTDPTPWYSDNAADRAYATRQCHACPLLLACAQYAIDEREPHGVWGGTTAADRKGFRDGRPWRFDEQGRLRLVCGSEDAYRQHFGYREQPCSPCVAAHEEHITAQRRERLAEEHAKGGTQTGYFLHRRLGEQPCAECKAGLQADRAAARRRGVKRRAVPPLVASVVSGATEGLRGAHAGVQRVSCAA